MKPSQFTTVALVDREIKKICEQRAKQIKDREPIPWGTPADIKLAKKIAANANKIAGLEKQRQRLLQKLNAAQTEWEQAAPAFTLALVSRRKLRKLERQMAKLRENLNMLGVKNEK